MMYKSDSWEGGDDLVFKNTSIIVSIASMGKLVRLLAVVVLVGPVLLFLHLDRFLY